ncbi:flagellar type III secretion system pore protein FliP [Ilumatobacter sp.]|uniref:flagellar type III secretion system pore protein FliP n=1 Tax=Ilumatobacter sp. TaxID=1967498 RepID=UPI003B519CBD
MADVDPLERTGSTLRRCFVAAVLAILAICVVTAASPSSIADAAAPTPPEPPAPIVEPAPIPPVAEVDEFAEPTRIDTSGGFPQVLQQPAPDDGESAFEVALPDVQGESSNVVVIILLLSVLSIAPSILVLTTSFTRIVIVLSLTRNALGVPQLPPQQVIVGLSLFLTLFVMGPTLETLNDEALQPLLDDRIELGEAYEAAEGPIREFMLQSTREPELEIFLDAADVEAPVERAEVPLTALIPAFVLSELKSAFIIGFVIFVPFLVIDLVVSAVLTSLGMMMLPPTFVSLPMKLLLFILLDGWTLVVTTLLSSYRS